MNLDRDPAIDIKVDTELIFKESSIDLEDCISLAYENRTDLKINELNLKFAELGEKVTDSQQLPKIDLTGTVGKAGEVFTPGKIQLSDDWFVGAKVSMPWGPNTLNYSYTNETIAPTVSVFGPTKDQVNSVRLNILDNLASYTEGKRSQVTREQAYSDLLKSKQTAATQVREAYFNYQETVLKVKNSISNKELYNKELAIMKERRLMNEAQTQDIVGAKIKLAAEETNYISALIENKVAIAKLNKAIGIKGYFK
jgi:outer membrane protein TolC